MINNYPRTIFFFIVAVITFNNSIAQSKNPGADSVLDFILQNKDRASLFVVKNNFLVAKLNENRVMPLASTVKILIAVEFAKQAGNNIFDLNGYVPLSELDKYYIPNTDGNAHPKWLKHEKQLGHIKNDSIRMIDVARGMIQFSSNANTEYLMDTLGFDNVKSNFQIFGLTKHTPIYPLVSSLFIYQNPNESKESGILRAIKKMSESQYDKMAFRFHDQLKYIPGFKNKFRPEDLSIDMQKLWSSRLPASTTKEYVQIDKVLNDRKYFGKSVYVVLANVLETAMENPKIQEWIDHWGMKGGSTTFVLTKSLYATLKSGTKIEMAYFFNNLTGAKNYRLQGWLNDFDLRVLSDNNFMKKTIF